MKVNCILTHLWVKIPITSKNIAMIGYIFFLNPVTGLSEWFVLTTNEEHAKYIISTFSYKSRTWS